MKAARRLICDRTGAAAVEFALVGLPMILLLLGLVEFGRGLHIRNAIDAAADRAQRAIMVDPSEDLDSLKSLIIADFLAGQPEDLTVTHDFYAAAGVDYRVVRLQYDMQLLLPAPLGRTVSIASVRRVATPPSP